MGFKEKEGLVLKIMLVISIVIVAMYYDADVSKFIATLRFGWLNNFFLGLTYVSSEIIIFFFLTSLFLWNERKRKWIMPLWLSLGLSVVVSLLLKIAVRRPRPYITGIVSTLPGLQEASHTIWNFSFPSFQTMLPFAAVPILSKEFPKFRYIWISLAALIGFSRVYFGLHFLSDVIAGGLIGYLIGLIIVKKESENSFWERSYKKISEKIKKLKR